MKNLMTVLVIMLCGISYSQLTLNTTDKEAKAIEYPSNIERYGVDYELVNYTFVNGDSTILNQLDLDAAEVRRMTTRDNIYHDEINNVDILLYYKKRNLTTGTLDQKN